MPRRLWLLILFLAVLALLGGAWQWLASAEVITPGIVRSAVARLAALGEQTWAPAIVLLLYVIASLVVFPLSILVAATGLMFGAVWGFVYAFLGTLLAATATYLAGWAVGRDTIKYYGGERLNRLSSLLARRGVTTMILVSLLPIAPFTLTSMAAGAFHLRFRDYLLGTVIGIAPGLVAMTLIGSQLAALLRADDLDTVLITAAAILVAVGALAALRQIARRRRPGNGPTRE